MSIPPVPHSDTQPSTSPQTPGVEESPHASESRRPWFRSTWLLIVYTAFLIVFFCIIGFIPYWETFMDDVQKTFQRPSLWFISAETPSILVSPTSPVMSACNIIWVEHQADDLGKKSRAMVWEQKLSERVKTSGMTLREFYDSVVEHNPQLIGDDYEFKKGKTYFLPECQ